VVVEDLQTVARILNIRDVDAGSNNGPAGIYRIDCIVVAQGIVVDGVVEQTVRGVVGDLGIQVDEDRIAYG
jgi:hypothetical protein